MKICVFAASSENIPEKYKTAAFELGKMLANNNIETVFGAGGKGLMGALANGAASSKNAIITGILPERLNLPGIVSSHCTKVIVTKDMSERKNLMISMSDAFIALPGGVGTFDELFEVATLKKTGYLDKEIILYNVSGFYNDIFNMLDRMNADGFMNKVSFSNTKNTQLIKRADTLSEIISFLSEGLILHDK